MMQNKKSSKGITLISMILAVIVLMIIIGTISYSSRNSFQTRSLQNLYTDIDGLNDAVSVYYMRNKILPVYTSYYDYNGNSQEYGYITLPNTYDSASNTYFFNFKEDGRDADPSENNIYFGIVDIDRLETTHLNEKNNLPEGIKSNKFFENAESDMEKLKQSIKDGIFVMNMTTHKVYYTKGISSDGKKYFAKNVYSKGANYYAETELINVPNFSKTDDGQSLDETILSQGDDNIPEDAIKVKYFANGGSGAPADSIITKEMIEGDPYLKSYISITEPIRTGMDFLGWSFTSNDTTSKYYLVRVPTHGSYTYIVQVNGEDIRLPTATYSPGSTINLYAVWKVKDDVLLCYYPDDTGGIKPTISSYKVSRTSAIPDGVANYLCVDIDSSGYTLSWNWDNTENDEKEALYEGTRTIDITNEDSYVTTEPGTIKIKGSFNNLTVSIENGDKFNFKINDLDVLKIYNTELSRKRRNLVGSMLATEWLVGKNRGFTIPENLLSYKKMGIMDPQGAGSQYYVDRLDSSAEFFLKKMVVVEATNNISSVTQDYENNSYYLGTVATLPDETKNYGIYPYFAARNYRLSSSLPGEDKFYYHDNLQEAYDDSIEKAEDLYDNLTVLNTIKYSKEQAEYIYESRYDPACESVVHFEQEGVLALDCASYCLNRKKNIVIGNADGDTDITITGNSSSSGLRFEYPNNTDRNLQIIGCGKLKIDGGCSILSNTTKNLIYMNGSSKLSIIKATIENTNTTNTTWPMITTYSTATTACIGCEDEDGLSTSASSKDSDITLKNPNGYVLDFDRGEFYWNYGILYTKNVEYKGGYTPGTEPYITTAGTSREACIYSSGTYYKIQLYTRLWGFTDKDSGSERTYYSNNLYNAHDMYNRTNKSLTTKTLTFTKNNMSITNDYATITKDIILDYNTNSSNYISSSNGYLILLHDTEIKNCYMTLSTNNSTNGITIGDSSNRVTLNLTNSNINFSNSSVYRYCVYNGYGTFNLASNAYISGAKNGLYNASGRTSTINGSISNTCTGCINAGTLNLYGRISSTGSSYPALDNRGTANLCSGGMLTSSSTRTIVNSGTVSAESTNIQNSYNYTTGIAVENSGTLTLNNSTVTSRYGGLSNSGTATVTSTTLQSSNNTALSNSGTVNVSRGSVRAGSTTKAVVTTTGTVNFSNGTAITGTITINSSGHVYFPQGSSVTLSGSVTVNNNSDFTMGNISGSPSSNNPKVTGRVTVNNNAWFYYYDGYVGSLSIRGTYNPEFSRNGLVIPTTGSSSTDYVYSGSAHYIQLRTYDSDGTGSYWQGGTHYNADGSTPYVDPNPPDDGAGSGGGNGGGDFDEFGNENL